MSKSGNPGGVPGAGSMADTLDFVKNMWGGMKVPGMVMPSMSVDDINKQIADLKAVESWLTLNMSMLRSTIQALEVQSATLATLQAMSANMSAMMKTGKTEPAENPDSSAPFSFSKPGAEASPNPDAASQFVPPHDAGGAAPPFANPVIWWNLLQDQFKQAVNTATAPEAESGAPVAKAAPASRKKSPKSRD